MEIKESRLPEPGVRRPGSLEDPWIVFFVHLLSRTPGPPGHGFLGNQKNQKNQSRPPDPLEAWIGFFGFFGFWNLLYNEIQ